MSENHQYISVDHDPFAADVQNGCMDTTEEQREIFTSIQIGGSASSLSYNECISLTLSGVCDVPALVKSCEAVVQRHDALRATFSSDGKRMQVHAHVQVTVPVIDLADLNTEDKKKRLEHFTSREAEIPFDLDKGPVIRFAVFKMGAKETVLVFTAHHIVCDGWSVGILMQDMSKFYSAFSSGISPALEPAHSFSEYGQRQQQRMENGEYAEMENFWLRQYTADIPTVEMPVDKPRPAIRTFNASRYDLAVDKNMAIALKKLGAKNGCSYVNTLFAAFEVFMYRITQQSNLVVGLPAAGQSPAALYNMVGHCVNLLPIRTYVDGKMSFAAYIKGRKNSMFDAFDHQEFTMGSLLNKLPLQRNPSRIPLMPVVFNVDLGITNGVNFDGLEYRFTSHPRKYENFEMFVNASGTGDELVLECSYNTDLFDDQMIAHRMEELSMLLKEIVDNPDLPLSQLNMLTAQEQKQIFADWIGIDEDYETDKCIHELFEDKAKLYPDAVAVRYNNTQLTYRQLDQQANNLAVCLQNKGIKPGMLAAIYMERCADMIVSILGVLKAGATYVPIDLSYPKDRISYLLEDSGCSFILTQRNLENSFASSVAEVMYTEDYAATFTAFENVMPERRSTPDAVCYVIYTSGSTGKPKGVLVSHKTVVNYISYCNSHYFGNGKIGHFGLYSSLSFDLTVTSIFCSLTLGKSLTVFTQQSDIPEILKQTFHPESHVDVIKMTPAHILVLETLNLKSGNIKKAIVGGEELTPKHVEILRAVNPSMEIVNEYGPTEATVGCVIKNILSPADALTIGKAISNTQVYILDQNLQPLPPGIPGRLFIGGNGLAKGYHNRPELTDEKFITEKFTGAHFRLYDSGDLTKYRLDGDIEFLGRVDNQVKIRGYRIEIGEIEAALARQEEISELAVVVREDVPGDKRLVAYITLENNVSDIGAVKDRLRAELPEYMVPSAFVVLEQMPLTVNGKIDRKALPKPEVSTKAESANFEEPHNPVESMLAGIWSDILKLDRIGIHDNFFELGGHSLLGIKMMAEIENRMGVKLDYPTLFRASTISQLAKVINAEDLHVEWPIVVELQPGTSGTPLFFLHMHNGNVQRWRVLLKYLDRSQSVYALQPRGLDEKFDYHFSIGEMAAFYISEIKKIQPKGPYRLAGLCFGGTAAFEIARQLQQQGDQTELLFTINNYAPPANPLQYKIRETWDEFKEMKLEDKLDFALEKTMNTGKKMLSKLTRVFDSAQVSSGEVKVKSKPDIRWVHSVALLNYQPATPYKGNIVLVRTGEEPAKHYDEYLGWKRLTEGNITLSAIDGSDNDSIITEEKFYSQLGQKLNEELKKT